MMTSRKLWYFQKSFRYCLNKGLLYCFQILEWYLIWGNKGVILFQTLDKYFREVWIKVLHCFKIRIKYFGKIIISFLASGDLSSADIHRRQFGPRSGPTECRSWSGSRLLDTLMVFLKEFFKKVNFEKKSADDRRKAWKITQHAKS